MFTLPLQQIDHTEGHHQTAERTQAVRINPENGDAFGLFGVNRKLGNLDQAIFYLAKAIEMQDPVLDDLLELGRSYLNHTKQEACIGSV